MFYFIYKGEFYTASSMKPRFNLQDYQEITKEEFDAHFEELRLKRIELEKQKEGVSN